MIEKNSLQQRKSGGHLLSGDPDSPGRIFKVAMSSGRR